MVIYNLLYYNIDFFFNYFVSVFSVTFNTTL